MSQLSWAQMAGDEGTKLPTTPGEEVPGGGLKGVDKAVGAGLTPAAEEFGKELAPSGKKAGQLTNRVGTLLIRALEPLVYGLERSADWIEKAVTIRLEDVPPENMESPNPRVAVPAMQALVYSMDDELIREMFANLLAADMNAEKKEDVHPAFVELIKEMTPADARILKICSEKPQCVFTVRIGTLEKFATFGTEYSFGVDGLSSQNIGVALSNLERLGLLERRSEFPLEQAHEDLENNLKTKFEPRRQALDTPEHREAARTGRIEIFIKRNGLYLNPLGSSFVAICLNDIAASS
jgi:hypothetical protein